MPANAVRRGRAARLADTFLESHPLVRAEAIVAALVLLGVGFAAFGSHIVNGGFIMDDWSNSAKSRYLAFCCGPGVTGADPSLSGQIASALNDGPAGYHLGLTIIAPVVHFLFGMSMGLHLALAAALGAIMSFCFYVVVRLLGLERLPAALIAILVLIFPFSDSTRLWAMASFNQIAVILWLVGAMLAFAGLRNPRGRRAIALHVVALVLYACGTLVYEQVGGAVIATFALYKLWGATWRQAGVRFVADAVVAGVSLYIAATRALPRGILSWEERFAHARLIVDDAFTLLASVVVPFGLPSRVLVGGAVLAVVVVAALRRQSLDGGDRRRAAFGRWLFIAAAGVAGIGVGYLLTVPATYGSPLDAGIENRVNMLAAFGWVTLLYAVAMLAGLLLAGRLGRSPQWAAVVPLVVCTVVAAGYLVRLADSSASYDRSYAEQVKVLTAIGKGAPYPRRSLIFTFGHPAYTAPGVPVYSWVWDQPQAVKVWLKDPDIAAFAALPGTEFTCRSRFVYPENFYGLGRGQTAFYGRAYFVDTESGARVRIKDRRTCRQAVKRFSAGPLARGRAGCRLLGGGPATRLKWLCDQKPVRGV